jgi:putative protein kinase ArgK-like GTPase of G3E family
MNSKIVATHISYIRAGDTVEHNGKIMTVCNSDIKSGFSGITLFGDSYRLGQTPVKKVVFIKSSAPITSKV